MTHRSSQNAQATCILLRQPSRVDKEFTRNWPTNHTPRTQTVLCYYHQHGYCQLDNKQDCKIPQSLGSGLGMKKSKNICRLNGNLYLSIPFSLFFLLPCIPQSSVPYFSSSSMESSGKRRGKNIKEQNPQMKPGFYDCKHEEAFENYFTLKTLSDVTWMLTLSDLLRLKKF